MKPKTHLLTDLATVRRALQAWRKNRPHPRQPIRPSLWSELAGLAREHGGSAISRALRLDYCALKRQVAQAPAVPQFFELTGYWHPLRRLGRDMGDCFANAYARWITVPANVGDHEVSPQLGAFLLENGLHPAAEPLLKRALEASERVLGPEHPNTLVNVNNLAKLLESKGDYPGAEPTT